MIIRYHPPLLSIAGALQPFFFLLPGVSTPLLSIAGGFNPSSIYCRGFQPPDKGAWAKPIHWWVLTPEYIRIGAKAHKGFFIIHSLNPGVETPGNR